MTAGPRQTDGIPHRIDGEATGGETAIRGSGRAEPSSGRMPTPISSAPVQPLAKLQRPLT